MQNKLSAERRLTRGAGSILRSPKFAYFAGIIMASRTYGEDGITTAYTDGGVRQVGRGCVGRVGVGRGRRGQGQAGGVGRRCGPGRGGGPTAQDWAQAAGTITDEIVRRIGARVPRIHVGGQQ